TNTQEMIDLTAEYAANMGMEPYYLYRQKNMAGNFENVGYARPGKACLYNILIMEEKQTIAACGAGTTTKVAFPEENRLERIENVKDVDLYIQRIDEMIEKKLAKFRF
ncbi:MAG: coproporphyrinogen dehydrogenase HemZ, partial [Hungatella sp.]